MKVRYTGQSRRDIVAIAAFLGDRSPSGVRHFRLLLRSTERLVSLFPFAGGQTSAAYLRRIKIGSSPYLMFYEVTDTAIVIHAVHHGSRDPSTMPDHA